MKLSSRLEYIFSLCVESRHTVDVGTDHGKLAVALVLSGKAQNVTASDVNEKPLEKARQLVTALSVKDKVNIVLTDGLSGINSYSPDQIVIAGMGGELISDILGAAKWVKKSDIRLILQPMTAEAELRRFLFTEGFSISFEGAVVDCGKPYVVMVASYSGKTETPNFISEELGMISGRTPDEKAFLIKKKMSAEKRLIGARKKNPLEAKELEKMIIYINNCLEVI